MGREYISMIIVLCRNLFPIVYVSEDLHMVIQLVQKVVKGHEWYAIKEVNQKHTFVYRTLTVRSPRSNSDTFQLVPSFCLAKSRKVISLHFVR